MAAVSSVQVLIASLKRLEKVFKVLGWIERNYTPPNVRLAR